MATHLFYFFSLLFVCWKQACGQQPAYDQRSSVNSGFQPRPPNVRSTTGVEQYGARYQSPNFRHISASAPAAAYGVVQQLQPRAQPLPPALTSTVANRVLAPLATATTPIPTAPSSTYNIPPQQPINNVQPSSYFYPPSAYPAQQYVQPSAVDSSAYYAAYARTTNPFAAYQNNNPYAQRESPVTNFTFKEGTPPLYCAYGLPVPEYNTPRKRCIPNWPGCGIFFTCIMDV